MKVPHSFIHPSLFIGTMVLVLLLPVAAQGEEPPPPYQPPVHPGGQISLLEAVRLTLEHEPGIKLQEQTVAITRGLAQQATGQFDATLLGELSYEFKQESLTERDKEAERKKRREARENAEEGERILGELDPQILEWLAARDVLIAGGDTDAVTFTNYFDQAQWNLMMQTLRTATPEQYPIVRDAVLQWLGSQITALQDARAETATKLAEIYEDLRNLGAVPDTTQSMNANLLLQLRKPYRTGVVLTPFLDLSAESINYKGKRRAEELGGLGVTDSYRARVGFAVQVPLGRGRGVESAAAAERAASLDALASEATLAHAAATSVLQTTLAYWDLVGAQERLAAMERSLALQVNLMELTTALIEADEMPRVELNRARAREAEARAQVDEARRGVHEARLRLALVVGLQVDAEVHAPLAGDPFPSFPGDDQVNALDAGLLGDEAMARRHDLRAAALSESSGRALWRASDLDTRRRTDLDLEVSYAGLGENNQVTRGLKSAFTGGLKGPSARAGITVDWPLANNFQLGRLQQQRAIYSQRIIGTRDLERLTRNNVLSTLGSLRETSRQLQEYTTAVLASRDTTEAELEKLRLGTSTLLDAIVTEQRQLNTELALVASQQRLAQLLAQLRFDTGTLVEEAENERAVLLDTLLTLPAPAGLTAGGGHEPR